MHVFQKQKKLAGVLDTIFLIKNLKNLIHLMQIYSVFIWSVSLYGLSKVEHFHSSLLISTPLHVAIMRHKAFSNEQLHSADCSHNQSLRVKENIPLY